MASPAASNVDFDRGRIGQGELIAGISGLVLLVSLWMKWYGVKVAGGEILRGFEPSINAWQSFGLIDLILFVVALFAIGVAVLRGLGKLPDLPFPPATGLAAAGALALLLVLFRAIVTPIDTDGVEGLDVTRKIGLLVGLLSAAGVLYGGWRAMQETGATFSAPGAAGGSGTDATAAMPGGGAPGVPGGGAAGVGEGKSGPGAPHPGTSTGAPDAGDSGAAGPPAPDPVPGTTAPTTPPGLAGEPPREGGTGAPGIPGDRNPPAA